jgi:pseudaminic acid biosynthesis-associated methylase
MGDASQSGSDATLDDLWRGTFGDEYTFRNENAAEGREVFWRDVLTGLDVASVLEVGCNRGPNLFWLAELLGASAVTGVDVNERALVEAARAVPGVRLRSAAGQELPFPDRSFDLVFTTGVLIHVAPDDLPRVMGEIVRCADKFVLCGEYYASEATEVAYRGLEGALFKRDFGSYYEELFPELHVKRSGFLPRGETAWDDVTWWLLERT